MQTEIDDDKLHEECGVFGIFRHQDAAALTALGLHALQHRGQEASGIVSYDTENFYSHRALGLVGSTFGDAKTIKSLKGDMAIGHNRYSTTGEVIRRNIQPLFADLEFGGFSVAHNGNLTNARTLREELVSKGSLFQSTTDSEVILHLMAVSRARKISDRLVDAMTQIKGAYSLVALSEDGLYGIRDPRGIRPLVLGKLNDSYVLASETCALDIISADYIRDIEAGEMVIITDHGVESLFPFQTQSSKFCVFEYIYFARPDSFIDNRSVYEMRKAIGMQLAKEAPCKADIVVPVPDSGVPSAIGYAEQSGIPFELGIIRNHYIGRTFIEPTDNVRHLGVKLKHNANKAYLKDKSVVLIDDSIVRGTTSGKIVDMVRAAGAKTVHMRIASPPTKYGCFYGINTPSKEELIAHNLTVDEMAEKFKVDSLAYISVDGLYEAILKSRRDEKDAQFCDACFSGDYAVELVDHLSKNHDKKLSVLKERRAGGASR